MKRYRVALVGTGKSIVNHIVALRSLRERAEVVAAVDTDAGRVQAFCAQHEIPHCYSDASAMLAAVQPDLVHIVTPPATHLPLIETSLQAGAWVFCEKPLCHSLADFDRIAALEASTGRCVSTVLQWRFGSAAQHLKRLIADGAFGRPLVALCQTMWYRDMSYYTGTWHGQWATETGGVSASLGVHLMDLMLWLLGDWRDIRALVQTLDRAIEVEDVSMALIRFENGALANVTNSVLSPRQETYLRLDFQRASVEMTGLYRASNANWRFSLPDGATDEAALGAWQALDRDLTGSHEAQLAELFDSMDRGERPFISGAEARKPVEFVASLYKAGFTGQAVTRGSITPGDPFYESMNGVPQKVKPR